MTRTLRLLTALLVVSSTGWAEPVFRFRHYGVDDGLPSGWVNAIATDDDGFLWLGTAFGLERFDGQRFKTYRHAPQDPASLPRDYVRHVFADSRGRLWVGSEGGLSRFRPDSDDFESFLAGSYIRYASESATGHLWLATDRGLVEFDPETGTEVAAWQHDEDDAASLASDDALFTLEDRRGALWVGTNRGGLNRLAPDRRSFRRYQADGRPGSISHDNVLSLAEDSAGRIWVGTVDGLNVYDRDTDTFRVYRKEGGATGVVFAIAEDREGGLWFGSYGGLNRFDPRSETFWSYTHDSAEPTGIVDDRIRSLLLSEEGLLWVGTTNGLDVLDLSTGRFGLVRHRPRDPDSLTDSYVWCFLQDSRGRLWVGTKGGIEIFDLDGQRSIRRYQHDPRNPDSLSEDNVNALLEDREGRLWAATDGGGLDRLDEATHRFTHFRHRQDDPSSISSDQARALLEDRDGALWVGTTHGGLSRLRPDGGFDHFDHDPEDPRSLNHSNVYTLYEDRHGTLWVGTNGGLARLDRADGGFDRFEHRADDPASLSDDTVFAILEDARGALWLGTRGGLDRFDRDTGSFRVWRAADGLPDDAVYAILQADDGALWVSTNRGLARFDPEAETFERFDTRDGLQGSEFNSGAALRDDSGRLYFGGTEGFNAFRPEEILRNRRPPPVVLTDFLLFNEPVRIGNGSPLTKAPPRLDAITLEHGDSVFAFEFAALSYRQPEANRFRYRLEGLDADWIPTSAADRKAVFTGVPHGQYRFRVVAANDDGVWNEEGATVRVTIRPPWWLTWWMQAVYALLVVGAPFGFYFVRLTTYRHRQAELEAQVAARTAELQSANARLVELGAFKEGMTGMIVHDLKNPLGVILNGLEAGDGVSSPAPLRSAARQMLNLVLNILDVQRFDEARMKVELRPCSLRETAGRALDQVAFLARRRRLENGISPDTAVLVDPELVERTFVNLLTNAIKFTKEDGRIAFREERASDAPGLVRVEVVDDGAGIPPAQVERVFERFQQAEARGSGRARSTGLGLTFCRLATEAQGGRMGVESTLGEGTTFWLTLRLAGASAVAVPAAGVPPRAAPETPEPPPLTEDEKRLIAPFAAELAAIPIYRVSALNAVLERLESEIGERDFWWSVRVREAIFLADEPGFRALLERV